MCTFKDNFFLDVSRYFTDRGYIVGLKMCYHETQIVIMEYFVKWEIVFDRDWRAFLDSFSEEFKECDYTSCKSLWNSEKTLENMNNLSPLWKTTDIFW